MATGEFRNSRRLAISWPGGVPRGPPPVSSRPPTSIAFDSSGNFYVSEFEGSRVQVFSPSGKLLGEVAEGVLAGPHGMAFDSSGALYMTDTGNGVVRKLRPSTGGASAP